MRSVISEGHEERTQDWCGMWRGEPKRGENGMRWVRDPTGDATAGRGPDGSMLAAGSETDGRQIGGERRE